MYIVVKKPEQKTKETMERLENKDVLDEKDRVLLKRDFPSNSHKTKTKEEPKKKVVKKVTKGKVVRKKKSLGKKFAETFLGADDVESVAQYVIYDVVVPAVKNMFADTVSNSVEMLLFGKTRGSRTRRDKGKSYVSYGSYYDRERSRGSNRTLSNSSRNRHDFDDIILEDRGEAEEVLSFLVDLIDEYGMASVGDLYDLVDISKSYTDNKYGWDNLSMARIEPVRGGYVIRLPRTILLD